MDAKEALKILFENEDQYQHWLVHVLKKIYDHVMSLPKTKLSKFISKTWKEGTYAHFLIETSFGDLSVFIYPERELIRFDTEYVALGVKVHDNEEVLVTGDDTFLVRIYASADSERLSLWKHYRSETVVSWLKQIFHKIEKVASSKYNK